MIAIMALELFYYVIRQSVPSRLEILRGNSTWHRLQAILLYQRHNNLPRDAG